MKKTIKKNIHEVTRIAEKMPRTLNEAIYEDYSGFGDISEDEEFEDDPMKQQVPTEIPGGEQTPVQEPVQQNTGDVEAQVPQGAQADVPDEAPIGDMPEEKGEGDALNVEQFVDDIRKKSLRGMAQLAENPDDERYQLLKKIWQICDKKPEQQTAFSSPNGTMPQKKI